ncbi:MAG: hypothetical protein JSS53_00555 [Proteobacteria bacterium]|nr:hypothetical protein [Pseudomonadota bacterium]
MKLLKIYGEAHNNLIDQNRKKNYRNQAEQHTLILFQEGLYFNTEELKKSNYIYGVEDALLSIYGDILKCHITTFHGIRDFMALYNLDQENKILDCISQLDSEVKKNIKSVKQSRHNFTEMIVDYVKEILFLAFGSPIKDFISGVLKENHLLDIVGYHFIIYDELLFSEKIDIVKFDLNFFRLFFEFKKLLDPFLRNILLPKLLTMIRTTYETIAQNANLSTDKLRAFFDNPCEEDIHSTEILINLRNHVFCNNIFLILKANTEKNDFSFIVGNDHIEGLKIIFESRKQECNELNLRVEYYSKNFNKEEKKDDCTKPSRKTKNSLTIKLISEDSPILANTRGSSSQQSQPHLHYDLTGFIGRPVCLAPKR